MGNVNISGPQNTALWDLNVNSYTFTGASSINNGQTITTSGTANPIIFGGAYTWWNAGTTGSFVCVGNSDSDRVQIQPTGATTTWARTTGRYMGTYPSGNGVWTQQYNDVWFVGHLSDGAANESLQNIQWWMADYYGIWFKQTAGSHTFANLSMYFIALGMNTGAAAKTLSSLKTVYCTVSTSGTTGVITVTNWFNYRGYLALATLPNGSAVTRLFCFAGSELCRYTDASPGNISFTECYVFNGPSTGIQFFPTTTGTITLADSVIISYGGGYGTCYGKVISSGNDIISLEAVNLVGAVSSDNDFLVGSLAQFGRPNAQDQEDWALHVFKPDTDSGNKTSTSTPQGYSGLTNNRTNPRSSPNKATSWSGISATVAGGNVTFAGTSGIRCKSCVEIALSSGGTPILRTPWKYDGLLNPWKAADFTLPATSHSDVRALNTLGPDITLWYRWVGEDGLQREFYSSWDSFTTPAVIEGAVVVNIN